jgi:hypothetical protein
MQRIRRRINSILAALVLAAGSAMPAKAATAPEICVGGCSDFCTLGSCGICTFNGCLGGCTDGDGTYWSFFVLCSGS